MFLNMYKKYKLKTFRFWLLLVWFINGIYLNRSDITTKDISGGFKPNRTHVPTISFNSDFNSNPLNSNITILHEVHDGSYSKKKDRPEILPLKPLKKKPHTLLDKLAPSSNYGKSKSTNKTTKSVEPITSMLFDFNLGDFEDSENDSNKKDDVKETSENDSIVMDNNKKARTNDNTLNREEEIDPLLNTTTIYPPITSTSSSVSYSFSSSVVTLSPHIFKVLKSKPLKKSRDLLKHEDQQKNINNNYNSILHYLDVSNENNTGEDGTIGINNFTLKQLYNVNVFQTFVNLYDHFYWQSSDIRTKVSTGCGLEMQAYLTGLHGNFYWAQKAYDASGHYRGQLFFGNDKWLGQKPFCYELNRQSEANLQKHIEFEFFTALVNIHIWLPEKLVINLQLGECLPKSCSTQDVQHILTVDPHVLILKALKASNATTNIPSFKILRVRTTSGTHNYWSEVKFQLFASFLITIIGVVLVATWYQSKLNSRSLHFKRSISTISKKMDTNVAQHITSDNQRLSSFELYQISEQTEPNNNITSTTMVNESEDSNLKYSYGNGNNDNNQLQSNHQSTQTVTPNENATINETEYKIGQTGHHFVVPQTSYKVKQDLGLHEQLLLCFAFQTNASNILNIDNNKEMQTSCVHGLRVISVLWTIMVHTYLQMFSIGENRFRRIIVERSSLYQIVGNATFSVDTFFFISGFLITLLFLKLDKKYPENTKQFIKKGISDTFVMLIYRYIRLTPAYLFVILSNDLVMRHTFDNSIFQPTVPLNTCTQFWWRNILYVNNFYPLSEICMIWSWYMANEMQFYIMATILLIISLRYFKFAVLTILSFLLSSWGIAGMMSLRHHYTHKVSNPFESFDFLYDKPWQRVGTYFMGMFTGFIVIKMKKPPRISNRYNNLAWFASIGLLTLIIFGVWKGELDEITTSFYVSIGHTAFGLSLVWIVLSCCWGLAPTMNRILSYRCLWPLSRLTYCAYLIHPVIMLVTAYRMDGTIHLNNVLIGIIFLGNSVLSFIVAFFISIIMEAPIIRILKILFHK